MAGGQRRARIQVQAQAGPKGGTIKKIIAMLATPIAALTLGAGLVCTAAASSLPIIYNGNDWTQPSAARTSYVNTNGLATYKITWTTWWPDDAYGHGWTEGSSGWKYASIHLYRPESHGGQRYFSRATEKIPLGNGYTVVNYDSYDGTWDVSQECLPHPVEDC